MGKRRLIGKIVILKELEQQILKEFICNVLINYKKEVKKDNLVKSFIVSSFRLDKIISSFYKISRQKAAEFIRAGHVKVNHKPVEQINYLCNNKDIISFKKHGRVMFVDCN